MKNKVAIGHKAPFFEVKDVFDEPVSLESYKNKKLLLVFLRYAGCPFCNLSVHRLTLEYPILEKSGCDVITFIQSPKEAVIESIYNRHAKRPPFKIIADPNMDIYKKYKVKTSLRAPLRTITKIPYWVHAVSKHGFKQKKVDGNFFLVPAMFLLDKTTQNVLESHYGKSFYEHQTFTDIYESLNFSN